VQNALQNIAAAATWWVLLAAVDAAFVTGGDNLHMRGWTVNIAKLLVVIRTPSVMDELIY
jgi:hypothetical protein